MSAQGVEWSPTPGCPVLDRNAKSAMVMPNHTAFYGCLALPGDSACGSTGLGCATAEQYTCHDIAAAGHQLVALKSVASPCPAGHCCLSLTLKLIARQSCSSSLPPHASLSKRVLHQHQDQHDCYILKHKWHHVLAPRDQPGSKVTATQHPSSRESLVRKQVLV